VRRIIAALVVALLTIACARADPPDERVQVAQRTAERFHDLYNADVGSVVAELMGLDDTATVEWGEYMTTQRERFGRVRRTRPIGSEVVQGARKPMVELRYATTFDAGDARELFVVLIEGESAKLAFYASWWQ
jgi:hypothetical protein